MTTDTESQVSGLPAEAANIEQPAAPEAQAPEAGTQEPAGKKDDQQQHQPAPGSKRFNQVYGEAQHWKREAVEFKSKLSEYELKLKAFEEKEAAKDYAASKEEYTSKIQNALDIGDTKLAATLQLEFTERMLQQSTPKPTTQTTTAQDYQEPQQDVALESFMAMNPWYGQDMGLTNKTRELDAQMKQDPNWATRPNAEFLPELQQRLNDWRATTNNPYRGYAPVGGVQTPPTRPNAPKELSSEEKKMAEMLLYSSGRVATKEEAYARYAANKK